MESAARNRRLLAGQPRYARAIGCLMLLGAITAAYGWTLDAYFTADDFGLVGRFVAFPWSSWPGLFFRDWSYGIWTPQVSELRPISALSFMVDGRLWGINATGYHLTNLVIHLVCSTLVMLIAGEVLGRHPLGAWAAGLVFALHPVAAGAVVWVSGRSDLLAAAGLLLGFLAFLRYRREERARWLCVAWCAFALGLFSKESCLVLPGIAVAHDLATGRWRDRNRQVAAPYLGWAAVLMFYAYCRSFGMDAIVTDTVSAVGPVGMAARLPIRVIPYALSMFVAPAILLLWKPLVAAHVVVLTVAGLGTVAAIGVLMVQGWRRGDPSLRTGLYYSLIWPMLATAPLVVTYLSFRHLYVATAGFAIGAIALLARQIPSGRWFALASAGVVALYGMQLAVETPRYREALAQSSEIREAVNRLAQVAAAGDVVVLDVPRRYREMWVWAWASPFALRPPFVAQDLTRTLIVIERPAVFRRPKEWPRDGTGPRLRRASATVG